MPLASEIFLKELFKWLEDSHTQMFKLLLLKIPSYTCLQFLIDHISLFLSLFSLLFLFFFFFQKDLLSVILESYYVSLHESANLLVPSVLISFLIHQHFLVISRIRLLAQFEKWSPALCRPMWAHDYLPMLSQSSKSSHGISRAEPTSQASLWSCKMKVVSGMSAQCWLIGNLSWTRHPEEAGILTEAGLGEES